MSRGCAIVAGGSSGIGAATVWALAARNIDVIAVSRSPGRLLEVDQSRKARRVIHPLAADMTSEGEIDRVFTHAESIYGPVRFVIHSVGHAYQVGWYREASAQAITETLSALVSSPALVLNRALKSLQSTGGSIGIISSGAANKPTPGRALYSSSKIAVNRLVESVAEECAAYDPLTAVFGISPGRVDTPMQRRLIRTAQNAPAAFRLEAFRSTDNVAKAVPVGVAIASLLMSPPTELNGSIFRYSGTGWHRANG